MQYGIKDEILDNPDLAIAVFTQLKEERERRKELENTTLIQRQQIAQLQPKASYYDLILQNVIKEDSSLLCPVGMHYASVLINLMCL